MFRKFLTMTIALPIAVLASATSAAPGDTAQAADTAIVRVEKRPGLIQRVINYFNESNKSRPTGRMDFSFIGGPHYSTDSKFGVGVVASGIYTTNPQDTALAPSNLSIKADATTAAHFTLTVSGEHISPKDVYRLSYEVDYSYIDTKYWGIGFDQCENDANESKYKYLASNARVIFARNLGSHFYLGPVMTFNYVHARDFQHPQLWAGLPRRLFSYGIGVSVRYDTRDNTTAPSRGAVVRMDQTLDARWMGNRHGYSVNEITLAGYAPVWHGGVLAAQLHWRITWGDTPWGMMSYIGGSHNMRGYFEGRYRDKSEADFCAELRQHVWRRNSAVVWLGVASVFSRPADIRLRRLLPNAGIGYRWEFKKNVNVRVDIGFGRRQTGIIFNINEAF